MVLWKSLCGIHIRARHDRGSPQPLVGPGLLVIFLLALPVPHAGAQSMPVHAGFDLSTQAGGPFPSNWFTVADDSQNTGRRVNLPLPDLNARPSDYADTQVLNNLDGFNLQARLSIPSMAPST
jgi:hypothetical protein